MDVFKKKLDQVNVYNSLASSSLSDTRSLTRNFAFRSVYDHDYEGTTFQNKWLTVDYMFYR